MRDYQFINGPETATQPTATDPVVDADLVTLGYANSYYVRLKDGQTQINLTNNSGPNNITGLIFDKTVYRSVEVKYTIERYTATKGFRQTGRLICHFEGGFSTNWTIDDVVDAGSSGDVTGVLFQIDTSTGQIQYTTDNMSGSGYVGHMSYKVVNEFPKET